MEAFKPQTAEEWDALIQGTTQSYVKWLLIEARAKDTSESSDITEGTLFYPPLNEVWGTPIDDDEIIWEDSRSEPIDEGAQPGVEVAQPGGERAAPLALPVEQGEFEDNEEYFDRIASFYEEGKRGKQDPTIEYAFDRVIERTLRQSFPQELNQLSDPATRTHYKLQYYYNKC
jgi:hypothetical protein